MKKVVFSEAEVADHPDFTAIGQYAQDATDVVFEHAIGYPSHHAAFTVTEKSAQILTISKGYYVAGQKVYHHEDLRDLNIQLHIPAASSDQCWIALILRGDEVTVSENRPFETSEDPETSEIVQRSTPKIIKRVVNVIVQAGTANPVAVKPVVAETDACIAYVLLTSQGIDTIEYSEPHRVKSLYEVEGRVRALEVDLDALFMRTETIETQIVNIWGKLTEIPRPEVIMQMQRDLGATRLAVNLPDEARAYKFDQGLIPDAWDTTHANWLARIDEGIRFAFAAQKEARLEVQAEDDPKIHIGSDRRMVPAYDEVVRIANASTDATLNISQLTHTEVTMIRKEISRERITYGPTQWACENQAGWSALGGNARVGQQFRIGDEIFEVVERRANHGKGHQTYGVRQVRIETYTDAYWEYVTEEIGLNGSIYGQTFLVAQPMQLTAVELSFSKVGSTGDVHILIAETTENGAPRFDAVLAKATLAHSNLQTGWVKCQMPLTLLESGKRYAILTVTTGAHSVHISSANKYTGGTLFHTTDGAWAQGSVDNDLCFRLYGARYRSPRTVIPMVSLDLADGMTQIEFLYTGNTPGGCKIGWEIKAPGDTAWTEIDDENVSGNPLIGLPAMLQLRMVMMGTADLQPMITLDAKAISRVARNRPDMTAVSDPVDFAVSTDAVVTHYTLDAYDENHHTFTPRIMVGSTTITPTATEVSIDPQRPSRRTYKSTYALSAETSSARMRFSAATDTVVNVPFVQDVFIAAQ